MNIKKIESLQLQIAHVYAHIQQGGQIKGIMMRLEIEELLNEIVKKQSGHDESGIDNMSSGEYSFYVEHVLKQNPTPNKLLAWLISHESE